MEQRKKYKKNNHIEYHQLNKEIANECRKAKEQWLTDQCQETEKLKKQQKCMRKSKIFKIRKIQRNKRLVL